MTHKIYDLLIYIVFFPLVVIMFLYRKLKRRRLKDEDRFKR